MLNDAFLPLNDWKEHLLPQQPCHTSNGKNRSLKVSPLKFNVDSHLV